jgi:hypothetical protein
MNELIDFDCEVCNTPLEIKRKEAGKQTTCPVCDGTIRVPVVPFSKFPEVSAARDPNGSVRVGLPGGPGFQAEVSRSDAGKLAFTCLGGLLALFGVIFGFRMRGKF